MTLGTSTKIRSGDFSGGFYSSKFAKQLRNNLPKSLIDSSERKTLYKALSKRSSGGLTKQETEGALREVMNNPRDNISRNEALKTKKHLEQITGYKNLNWSSAAAQKNSRPSKTYTESGTGGLSPEKIIKKYRNLNRAREQAEKMARQQKSIAHNPQPPNTIQPRQSLIKHFTSLFTKNNKSIPMPATNTLPSDSSAAPAPAASTTQTAAAPTTTPQTAPRLKTTPQTQAEPSPDPSSKSSLYSIVILLADRQSSSRQVNEILSDFSHLFLGRFGIPLSRECVEKCSSVISLIAESNPEEIEKLKSALDPVPAVVIKITQLPHV
ncbi:MAG: hypothetical protein ABIC19_04420 [Patescibacteria group bacterium]